MLKRRIHDILAIIFILLVLIILAIQFYLLTKPYSEAELERVQECDNYEFGSQNYLDCIQEATKGDLLNTAIFNLILYILAGVYYLFILVLAIQLHKREKLSMLNTIVIALIVPLAVIFYFATLRKPLKEFEKSHAYTSAPKQPQY